MIPPAFDLSLYPTTETIRLLASLLERMTVANDQLNATSATGRKSDIRRTVSASPLNAYSKTGPPLAAVTHAYTRFHAHSIPSINIYSYLSRILKYCPCSNECFLSLLVYFDRMSKQALASTGRPFAIDSYNIHRLVIAGVMVSSKFFSDVFYTNIRYARVGGLPVSELNSLELEFLKLNDFNLSVSTADLQRYGDQLIKVGFMEQELRKTLQEVPYSATQQPRHNRSTSLGSMAHPLLYGPGEAHVHDATTVDRLCDLTARISMDGQSLAKHPSSDAMAMHYRHPPAYTAPYHPTSSSYLPRTPSSSNLRLDVRRMTSFGNLRQQLQQPSPGVYGYPTPGECQYSPVALEAQEAQEVQEDCGEGRSSAWTRPASEYYRLNRHSLMGEWTHASPKNTRSRHGSMGVQQSRGEGWHRTPRHTQSSVNMQADYCRSSVYGSVYGSERDSSHSSTTSIASSTAGTSRRLSLTSIHAPPFIPTGIPTGSYHSHYPSLGIPTPPPSSSPVHQHHSHLPQNPSTPPHYHHYPTKQPNYPVVYL
ncbi:cyclin-domain-containing protein [Spinellus fusiger]|nr:cyclin-domain-containing protein [Spinellus fusiger]